MRQSRHDLFREAARAAFTTLITLYDTSATQKANRAAFG
jgi:hypothetical protein